METAVKRELTRQVDVSRLSRKGEMLRLRRVTPTARLVWSWKSGVQPSRGAEGGKPDLSYCNSSPPASDGKLANFDRMDASLSNRMTGEFHHDVMIR